MTNRIPTMLRRLFIACFFSLPLLSGVVQADVTYYNIAHAINHSKYIDWAIRDGANGIEADLQFTKDGKLVRFQHGFPCECALSWRSDLCNQMYNVDWTYQPDPGIQEIKKVRFKWDACWVNEVAPAFLNTLAKKPIALFIVDSKIGKSKIDTEYGHAIAGHNLIKALEEHLFGKEYKGNVIVGVDKAKHETYIRSAAATASTSPYRNRIYFSFDQNGESEEDARKTIELLEKVAPGRAVYGNGISAYSDGDYKPAFAIGVAAEKDKKVRLNYIWTLDNRTPMATHIALGIRGIMTNNPKNLREILNTRISTLPGHRMARPEDPL